MSTNYYLVNKKEETIHTDFVNLIQSEMVKLNTILVSFCKKHNLDEEDIEERIKTFENILKYDVFNPQELPICLTTANELIWQSNEYYKDVNTFADFYKRNSDIYYIQNEYEQKFSIEQFLSLIQDFKIINCSYSDFS